MRISFAPLEGVTGAMYRRVHRQFYPGLARYYTPFLSPTGDHRFTGRNLRELELGGLQPDELVPQLLTKNAQDFLWAAENLREMGFTEVNLNLGCPSGTVVPKGKGAGFLARPAELEQFLDEIFAKTPLPVSVKTRLGLQSEDEFPPLLELFNRYPICELTIHPRTRVEFYKGEVHLNAFAYAVQHSKNPLCYNGNLFSETDLQAVQARFPTVDSFMAGRGLVARPSLFTEPPAREKLRQELSQQSTHSTFTEPPERERLRQFHEELVCVYRQAFGSTMPLLAKLKELWTYMLHGFADEQGFAKQLIKAQSWQAFYAVTQRIFDEAPLLKELLPF